MNGFWKWRDAYEACEAAQTLFLRRFGPATRAGAHDPAGFGRMLAKVAALLPTQTRRYEDSPKLQQFSTPIELAHAVTVAAAVRSDDVVLEPSAGTGLLVTFAELAIRHSGHRARLVLNELADARPTAISMALTRVAMLSNPTVAPCPLYEPTLPRVESAYSDRSGRAFRFEAGHRSDVKPATIPI